MVPSEATFSRSNTCRFLMGFSWLRASVDERQEPHVARPLDGVLEHALALGREPGAPAREHLPLATDALPQELDVLVVEVRVLGLDLLVRRSLEAVAAIAAFVAHGSDLLLGHLGGH